MLPPHNGRIFQPSTLQPADFAYHSLSIILTPVLNAWNSSLGGALPSSTFAPLALAPRHALARPEFLKLPGPLAPPPGPAPLPFPHRTVQTSPQTVGSTPPPPPLPILFHIPSTSSCGYLSYPRQRGHQRSLAVLHYAFCHQTGLLRAEPSVASPKTTFRSFWLTGSFPSAPLPNCKPLHLPKASPSFPP